MEKIQKNLYLADKTIKLAGHMLYVTYPLVKDNKLFIGILENIDKSLKLTLDSILYYERMYKRINPYPDDFNSKIEIFKKLSKRYDVEIYKLILEIDDLIRYRKSAPVEFSRKEDFVLCNENYKTKILKLNDLKEHLSKAKFFILKTSNTLLTEKK